MPGTATETQPGTKAAMIHAVLGAKHPKLSLPTIAAHFRVTLTDLQTILNQNGYPDRGQLRAALGRLQAEDDAEPEEIPTVDDTSDSDGIPDSVARRTMLHVEVAKIHPDPNNPREKLTEIGDLAGSIKTAGLLEPPIVRRASNGHLYLVAGHRRLAAVRSLGWTKVDVILNADMRPDEVLAAMLIENGQRVDLDAIEEARALHRLKTQLSRPGTEDQPAHVCSEAELAQRIGRSLSYVNGRLLLLNLTAEEQQAVREGRLGVTAATGKARNHAGRYRNNAVGRVPGGLHLSSGHDLADRARSRCTRLKHSRGKSVGGIACGECWESVIRADERQHLHDQSENRGRCVLCDTHHDPDKNGSDS